MKAIRNLFRRLKHSPASRQGKKGSSLAIVMMVGAVLVIWVMCIMPIMATTGTVAIQTEESYDDYMIGRSAVEYCKSELEHIVETKIPYTFALTGNPTDGFTVQPKWNTTGQTPLPEYAALVRSPDSLDDRKDVPTSDSVVAICAVEPSKTKDNVWDIVITTYDKCDKVMSYSATFTGKGSLLIYPEAYKQNQALPLSGFVLVDGKYGDNTVWNSTINMNNAEKLNFNETLLRYVDRSSSEWHPGYANTGEYPAVFKTTVNSAYDPNATLTDPVTIGALTSDESWVEPKAGNSEPGNIWFDTSTGKIKIYMRTNSGSEDITSACTVYLNGRVTYDLEIPTTGVYKVSVDFAGTDYSTDVNLNKYDKTKTNVLPINGLQLSGEINKNSVSNNPQSLTETAKIGDISKEVVYKDKDKTKVDYTEYTVTIDCTAEGLLYGMCDEDGKVTWQNEKVFKFRDPKEGDAYFFYICRPATYVDGVYNTASDAKMAGMIYMPKFVNSFSNSDSYVMLGEVNGSTYQLNNDLSASAIAMDEGFVVGEQNIGGDKWKAYIYGSGNNSNKSLVIQNPSEKNLNILPDVTIVEQRYQNGTIKKEDHYHSYGYGNGEWTECALNEAKWDGSLYVGFADNGGFKYSLEGSAFKLYRDGVKVEYNKFSCGFSSYGYNKVTQTLSNSQHYLGIASNRASVTDAVHSTSFKFMQAPPSAPTNVKAPGEDFTIDGTVTHGTDVLDHVRDELDGVELVTLYANNQEVDGALNSGKYHLVAKVKINNVELFVNLGNLTVNKASLDASDLDVTVVRDQTDEFSIDVSATGWHSNGGIRYFGYLDTEKRSEGYHWYISDNDTFTFRLEYGTYEFAVMESGTLNYKGIQSNEHLSVEISMQYVELVADDKPFFQYTMSDSGEIQWYKLPKDILPNRVDFVYGYTNSWSGREEWHLSYKGESYDGLADTTFTLNKYAVYVEESTHDMDNDYGTDWWNKGQLLYSKMFKINEPLEYNITAQGRAPSLMRGSSLYFMGRGNSMNTHGTDIFLETDLLVLYADVTGGGRVIVDPYTTGQGTPGDILFFAANSGGITRGGQTLFEGRMFYRIPAGTDLCNLNATTTASWKIGDIYDDDVKYLFRQGVYPEIDLDIAYTSTEQLSRVISSETIGWTVDGVLSGTSSNTNAGYAITAYVTEMGGETNYKANRILLAANNGTSWTLDVTSNLTFTTRYLSVEADQIIGHNTNFILNNLAQDQAFVQWLSNALGLTNYSSKSLQMDYERNTQIINGEVTTPVQKQICRYENGTNLLGQAENMSLTAEYTTREIEDLFNNGFVSSIFGSTVKTVDRYVSLKADNDDGVVNIDSWITGSHLDIYANYVYIDSSVKEFNMSSWLGGSDIRISSQESGYTTQEYLGIFKGHSAESYTGTILYFADSVRINLGGSTKTVSPGFYWLDATDNGTSLTVLADNPNNYRIDPDELKEYSIYINDDGTLSNAYVDTGLEDNNSPAVGGFSGGSIE